ncbi:MAG: hypothetical protein WCF10_05995 [Polyangiales bacterium]
MRNCLASLMFAFAMTVSSCVPSVDIPEAPDMDPVLSAYAEPTATVLADVMAVSAEPILEAKRVIEETAVSEQLLVLIEKLQKEIDSAGEGEGAIVVNGVSVSEPNGAIRLHHVCSGWEDTQDGDPDFDGTIAPTLTLHQGLIGAVVWATFDRCRWKRTVGNRSLEIEYDGEISAHFGESFRTDTLLRNREITFEVIGNVVVNGRSSPIDRSFRLGLAGAHEVLNGRLDILIGTRSGGSFVFFFRATDFPSGVQDATGRFSCSLEERTCDRPSGSFSW